MSPIFVTASCNAAAITERSSISSASNLSGSVDNSVLAFALALDTADGRAAGAEFLFQPFETAIQVIDPIDHRLAARRQPCDHETDGRSEIGRHHFGAFQRAYAAYARFAA